MCRCGHFCWWCGIAGVVVGKEANGVWFPNIGSSGTVRAVVLNMTAFFKRIRRSEGNLEQFLLYFLGYNFPVVIPTPVNYAHG